MDRIKGLVNQVIKAFDSRRRTRWSATGQPLTVTDPELKRWHQVVEERLKTFRFSTVDRFTLLDRVRRRFKGKEWTADFAGAADELQRMARSELQRYLQDNGVPEEPAGKIAAGYSVGALLHES